ncbi:beta-N-acetylhexosaminidase [Roseospirillum parvum]|uniref:beta-N-acetylhexosaminidase n=1 Tax=Roseospirillum parvum TaxID=83401 RepID=A0A1G7YJ16_9PROT|nr:beta-N-acetylhexosaminidase [Roseospirillum parvum]SDG96255.1 beta-N-acetylhexosaminidase [Roseospirillum parvum]
MPDTSPTPRAVVLGLKGLAPTADERRLFAQADPFGFILFARNVAAPDQVRALVAELRQIVGRRAPVFIDQEGGRVQRLKPPHWRAAPAAARLVELYARDPEAGVRAAFLNARLIAAELADLGIDVDCTPVLDLPAPGAHEVIGDRAHGADPATAIALGRAVMDGMLAGGVWPVIKHLPGHGRAEADSHLALPRVAAPLADLAAHDFAPFRALSDSPLAMTAHVVYEDLDPARPATVSPTVIEQVIRGDIGFDNLLVSDDLSMKALAGPLDRRAADCLAAGCDLALHCNGEAGEMAAVVAGAGPLSTATRARLARLGDPPTSQPFEAAAGLAELTALLG